MPRRGVSGLGLLLENLVAFGNHPLGARPPLLGSEHGAPGTSAHARGKPFVSEKHEQAARKGLLRQLGGLWDPAARGKTRG